MNKKKKEIGGFSILFINFFGGSSTQVACLVNWPALKVLSGTFT